MTREEYNKIKTVYDEIEMLSRWRDSLHHITHLGFYLRRNDGERDGTTDIPVTEDFSKEIINLIDDRISRLEEQFKKL